MRAVNGSSLNATIVSGIVPTRPGQYNGGLHNFIGFIEDWNYAPLEVNFVGSLIQLNFSTSATGPYDQENLDADNPQPLQFDNTGQFIRYYGRPECFYGYDIALQYYPPAPIAERFITLGTPRSEAYRELPLQDPYIQQLLDALDN